MRYYVLTKPYYDEHYELYGQPEWDSKYGRAEWSSKVDLESIVCPIDPGHQRAGNRIRDLDIILPSRRIGDFVWTWYSDCLITDKVFNLLKQADFSGFETRPVSVQRVKRLRSKEFVVPILRELVITGKGGDASPVSGIKRFKVCDVCGLVKYSSYRHGIILDEAHWDGSDFFTVNGYPKHILITERVKEAIISQKLTNCVLIPAEELIWPETVIRPEEVYPEQFRASGN